MKHPFEAKSSCLEIINGGNAMSHACSKYDPESISRFADSAVSSEEYKEMKRHMETCAPCRKLAGEYRAISISLKSALYRETDSLAEGFALDGVLSRIEREKRRRPAGLFGAYGPKKILLQAVSIAVIIVVGAGIYLGKPSVIPGPSAIVNYVEGDASSVMIFETMEEQHTVIWYTET